MKEHCVLNFIVVRSRVLDAQHRPVRRIHAVANQTAEGIKYLHGIELLKNLSLWPVELDVRSSIQTRTQVRYVQTTAENEWAFKATLLPNRGFPEQYALLGGWPTFAPLFFAKVGSRGLMQRRASFSSSPVPTEMQDLASIRRIHRSQAGWARGIPPFKKRKVGHPSISSCTLRSRISESPEQWSWSYSTHQRYRHFADGVRSGAA